MQVFYHIIVKSFLFSCHSMIYFNPKAFGIKIRCRPLNAKFEFMHIQQEVEPPGSTTLRKTTRRNAIGAVIAPCCQAGRLDLLSLQREPTLHSVCTTSAKSRKATRHAKAFAPSRLSALIQQIKVLQVFLLAFGQFK